MGYDFVEAPDHVLGANVASRPNWADGDDPEDLFHDPFVLLSYHHRNSRLRSATFPPVC